MQRKKKKLCEFLADSFPIDHRKQSHLNSAMGTMHAVPDDELFLMQMQRKVSVHLIGGHDLPSAI